MTVRRRTWLHPSDPGAATSRRHPARRGSDVSVTATVAVPLAPSERHGVAPRRRSSSWARDRRRARRRPRQPSRERVAALAAPEVRDGDRERQRRRRDHPAGTIALMIFAGRPPPSSGPAFVVARRGSPADRGARARLRWVPAALTGAAVVDTGNADFVILGDRVLNVAMFSGLFLAFGLVASVGVRVLRSAGCRRPRRSRLGCGRSPPCARSRSCPGLIGVAFAFASQLGVPLIGAWAAMLAASAVDRRGRHGLAQLHPRRRDRRRCSWSSGSPAPSTSTA